jgi:hypothetical protein
MRAAGIDRMVQFNVLAMSGKAVEASRLAQASLLASGFRHDAGLLDPWDRPAGHSWSV